MLDIYDALLKMAPSTKKDVDLALEKAIIDAAAAAGISVFDLENKARELCQYGGPVIYYP